MSLELFSKDNLDTLVWPATPDASYARKMLEPFFKHGVQRYIQNVHNTELFLLKLDNTLLPLTLSHFHPENSYVCSPYSHYVLYGGYEETKHIGNPLLGKAIRIALGPVATLLRWLEFDRVVLVNNWLLSTNLYPGLNEPQVEQLVRALPELFPERAIVFRSVDAYQNPQVFSSLLRAGYRMVLSRQVYYQEPQQALKKKQVKLDKRVMAKSQLRLENLEAASDAEIARLLALYNQLYLEKYSYFNPQFSEAFLRLSLENGLVSYQVLKMDERIVAVLGFFWRGKVMTQPIFGYDLGLSQDYGLYRLLSLQTLLEGARRGLSVHASAGVGEFKRLRGGVRVTEYNAVFDRHLPSYRRLPWQGLEGVSSRIAVPLFKKYGL
ncbi:MAG: GNAT family N-acetyltransferase [Trueperaceae bacterium]|nr:GNAT family N-acetyltransferase [Trueperaceae bacterium]